MGNNRWYLVFFVGNCTNSEESMRVYFEQFGEITECTVMRENQTGRSRGFGFLTFKDPKCVNAVMVKEHILDGKIVIPLRFARNPSLTLRLIRNGPFLEMNRTARRKSLSVESDRTSPRRNLRSISKILAMFSMQR